jgi:hypothetical protein
VQANARSWPEWRDAAAYAPLLDAERSLIAWEWLRRDPGYRAAAQTAIERDARGVAALPCPAEFGLVRFEPPNLGVPYARPLWRDDADAHVLGVERARDGAEDSFELDAFRGLATLVTDGSAEHLLLSDGFRSVRLDAAPGVFSAGAVRLRYRIEGLASAEPALLTLRRLLALCRTGRFARSLHPQESKARRWILMLRAWDALADGADQRLIARELFSRSAGEPSWRIREPSVRSRAQRLVRSARWLGNCGYRALLNRKGGG